MTSTLRTLNGSGSSWPLRAACAGHIVILAWSFSLFEASPSEASWPPSGVAVGGAQARANDSQGIPDGLGGWYIAWEDHQIDASHPDIRLQHLAASGDPVAGWPIGGIVVSGLPTDELSPQLAQDGSGGTERGMPMYSGIPSEARPCLAGLWAVAAPRADLVSSKIPKLRSTALAVPISSGEMGGPSTLTVEIVAMPST